MLFWKEDKTITYSVWNDTKCHLKLPFWCRKDAAKEKDKTTRMAATTTTTTSSDLTTELTTTPTSNPGKAYHHSFSNVSVAHFW
jgi:hypothetical protein